ncbi:sensor domain-containing protein [Nocardia jejuensis]|uniref:sensor domain-containing protein n=1 Tax=Nocardia jejuensis TaxID=328049 RepID=UPI00082AB3D6|nr:sensor domain-containing protein [Nocardia jejuensis]
MPLRAVGVAVLGCVLAACGTTVSGHPNPSRNPAGTTRSDAGLAALLPDPSQFPSRYAAVALPPDVAGQAAADLDGVLPDAQIDPSTCGPTAPTAGPVVSVGTDDTTRATLTVELTRVDQPLATLRNQLQQCGTVKVTHSGTTATVTTELDPPPPLDVDDALALRRVVRSESPTQARTMQTLLGQVGDIRINVTYMTFTDTRSDTEALDSLFTTAVTKVRKG